MPHDPRKLLHDMFRHILVHGYDAIDRDITWAVVSEKLPGLARQVERLLAETESDPRPL